MTAQFTQKTTDCFKI